MENLLTILNRITAYGTLSGYVELFENELCNVIGSRAANDWSANQRMDFMMFYTLFSATAVAAFNVRDVLRREKMEDLTKDLVKELRSDLYELSSFGIGLEAHELEAVLDLYIEILVDGDKGGGGTISAIVGNYFKTFFLSLHDLEIEKRIRIADNPLKMIL
jgi:hypothetical protein